MTPSTHTIVQRIWPPRANSPATGVLARKGALVVAGALALMISAKIQVPFYPVPMTLQTLVVLGLGAAFGARLAVATTPALSR